MSAFTQDALFTATVVSASNSTFQSSTILPTTTSLSVYSSNIVSTTSNALQALSQSTCNTFFTASNALYRQLNHASNIAVTASNAHIAFSNFYSPIGAFASNAASYASNQAFLNSNFVVGVSNSIYPIARTASNESVFASNASFYTEALTNASSNALHPLVQVYSCNTAVHASNLTAATSNTAVDNSNTIFQRGLFASNTAVSSSNVGVFSSNHALAFSNAAFPALNALSNAAFFSSNATQFGFDLGGATSNALYPATTFAVTSADVASNVGHWGSNFGHLFSNAIMLATAFASNAATFSCNTIVATSNTLYPASAFASNASASASNVSSEASNAFYPSASNQLYTQLFAASNAAVFASNLASISSNGLYALDAAAAAAGTSASNMIDYIVLKTSADSNHYETGFQTACNAAGFASNAAVFSSNLSRATSNFIRPAYEASSNDLVSASNASRWATTGADSASSAITTLLGYASPLSTYASNAIVAVAELIESTSNDVRSSNSEVSAALAQADGILAQHTTPLAQSASNAAVLLSNSLYPSLLASSNALSHGQQQWQYAAAASATLEVGASALLRAGCNLEDVSDIALARCNLGLGDASFADVSAASAIADFTRASGADGPVQFSWAQSSNTGMEAYLDPGDSSRAVVGLVSGGSLCMEVSASLCNSGGRAVRTAGLLSINGRPADAAPTVGVIAPVEFGYVTPAAGAVCASILGERGVPASNATLALERAWAAGTEAKVAGASSLASMPTVLATAALQQQAAVVSLSNSGAGGGCCVMASGGAVFDAYNRLALDTDTSAASAAACSVVRYTSNGDVRWVARIAGTAAGWGLAAVGSNLLAVVGEYETAYDAGTQQVASPVTLHDGASGAPVALTPSSFADSASAELGRRGFVLVLDAATGGYLRSATATGASFRTCVADPSDSAPHLYVAGQYYDESSAWSLAGSASTPFPSLGASDARTPSHANPAAFAAKLSCSDLSLAWCWGGADATFVADSALLPGPEPAQLVLAAGHASSNMPYFRNAGGALASGIGPMWSARSEGAQASAYVGMTVAINASTGSTTWVAFSDSAQPSSSNLTTTVVADAGAARVYTAGWTTATDAPWAAFPASYAGALTAAQSNTSLLHFESPSVPSCTRCPTVACYNATGGVLWASGVVGEAQHASIVPGSLGIFRNMLALAGTHSVSHGLAPLVPGADPASNAAAWAAPSAAAGARPAGSWGAFVATFDPDSGTPVRGGLLTSDTESHEVSLPKLISSTPTEAYVLGEDVVLGSKGSLGSLGGGIVFGADAASTSTSSSVYALAPRRPRAGHTRTHVWKVAPTLRAVHEVGDATSNLPGLGAMRHVINHGSSPVTIAMMSGGQAAGAAHVPSACTADFTYVGDCNASGGQWAVSVVRQSYDRAPAVTTSNTSNTSNAITPVPIVGIVNSANVMVRASTLAVYNDVVIDDDNNLIVPMRLFAASVSSIPPTDVQNLDGTDATQASVGNSTTRLHLFRYDSNGTLTAAPTLASVPMHVFTDMSYIDQKLYVLASGTLAGTRTLMNLDGTASLITSDKTHGLFTYNRQGQVLGLTQLVSTTDRAFRIVQHGSFIYVVVIVTSSSTAAQHIVHNLDGTPSSVVLSQVPPETAIIARYAMDGSAVGACTIPSITAASPNFVFMKSFGPVMVTLVSHKGVVGGTHNVQNLDGTVSEKSYSLDSEISGGPVHIIVYDINGNVVHATRPVLSRTDRSTVFGSVGAYNLFYDTVTSSLYLEGELTFISGLGAGLTYEPTWIKNLDGTISSYSIPPLGPTFIGSYRLLIRYNSSGMCTGVVSVTPRIATYGFAVDFERGTGNVIICYAYIGTLALHNFQRDLEVTNLPYATSVKSYIAVFNSSGTLSKIWLPFQNADTAYNPAALVTHPTTGKLIAIFAGAQTTGGDVAVHNVYNADGTTTSAITTPFVSNLSRFASIVKFS